MSKNAARRNGKAWKAKPGRSAKTATGRTSGGYSQAAQARRAARRTAAAIKTVKENA